MHLMSTDLRSNMHLMSTDLRSNMHLMSTDLRSKASVIPPHQKYPHIYGTNSQIY